MVNARRASDAADPSGLSGVLVVEVPDGHDAETVASACRRALRTTDAVVEQGSGGAVRVLLRHLRHGDTDVRIVADRVVQSCEDDGAPVRLGAAVASDPDVPLDQVIKQAAADLEDA